MDTCQRLSGLALKLVGYERLLDEFPDLPDGHMRLGQLFRARGEPVRAAQHLRLAAAVARAADDDPAIPLSLEAEADSLDPPSR